MAEEGSDSVEAYLYNREIELLQPGVRRDPVMLSALLADEFCEFGSSGKIYGRQEVIDALHAEPAVRFFVSQFSVTKLSANVALVRYQAVGYRESDQSSSRSLRSSLWVLRGDRWQMLFHQGTEVKTTASQQSAAGSRD